MRIDEQGNMGIHYLGTDPAMMVMPSLNARETKYDEYQSQTQRYQQIIREKSGTQGKITEHKILRSGIDQ